MCKKNIYVKILSENRGIKMKKYLITSICIVIILCIIGASYSLWNLSISQNSENIIESSCFDITFKEVENTNISLTNT